MKVYLDYNCFQRSFDDPSQIRIQIEALACQEIFSMAESGVITIIWSFIHEDENYLCPIEDRKVEALRLSKLCKILVSPKEQILKDAHRFQNEVKLGANDALHLASAVSINADILLTCDDKFCKKANRLSLNMEIMNPVDYIRKEEQKHD